MMYAAVMADSLASVLFYDFSLLLSMLTCNTCRKTDRDILFPFTAVAKEG